MRRCFYHTDLGQNLFFFALFKPIILQFFTILQDKFSAVIQYPGRSKHALPLHKKIIELTALQKVS